MVIKENINVHSNSLSNGLIPTVRIMSQIESLPVGSDAIIDFSQTQFISPVFVLSLLVYLKKSGRNVTLSHMNEYMQVIHMDNPIQPDSMRSTQFKAYMQRYNLKSYIPVISFPATSKTDDKENILTFVENLIVHQLSIPRNIVSGLKYMIDEIIDNITEHSHSERGYIFAQAYPNSRYLDICIADDGVTLLGSYQTNPGIEIADDLEALKAANRGVSSKNLPDAENRGYGIFTTKKMLVNGLKGQYMMMSGSSLYLKSSGIDRFLCLPDNLRWNGTIVAFRMPYDVPDFNYINYIE